MKIKDRALTCIAIAGLALSGAIGHTTVSAQGFDDRVLLAWNKLEKKIQNLPWMYPWVDGIYKVIFYQLLASKQILPLGPDVREEFGLPIELNSVSKGLHGAYSPSKNILYLEPTLSDTDFYQALLHELVHAYQYQIRLPVDALLLMQMSEPDKDGKIPIAQKSIPAILDLYYESQAHWYVKTLRESAPWVSRWQNLKLKKWIANNGLYIPKIFGSMVSVVPYMFADGYLLSKGNSISFNFQDSIEWNSLIDTANDPFDLPEVGLSRYWAPLIGNPSRPPFLDRRYKLDFLTLVVDRVSAVYHSGLFSEPEMVIKIAVSFEMLRENYSKKMFQLTPRQLDQCKAILTGRNPRECALFDESAISAIKMLSVLELSNPVPSPFHRVTGLKKGQEGSRGDFNISIHLHPNFEVLP